MTFLKWSMLIGLAAVAIPIILHLLNRSKPKPLDWGAMQFLLASLASQSRRILLEEMILLILRCLTFALLALAMARPFLPSQSMVPWILVLPMALGAAVCAAIAAALWNNAPLRRRLLQAAGILLVAALAASALERWIQSRWWFHGKGGRDLAIIVDASTSMNIRVGGESNFQKAVGEARSLVKGCRPGDGVALILAGPVPHVAIRRPTSDRREVLKALDREDFRPVGGCMAVLEALNTAASCLAEGGNPEKAVILFTDGQSAGWDVQSEGRWRFVAEAFKSFPVPPKIVCRRLPLPRTFSDAAIAGVSFSRAVIGTDRPVRIDVKVVNAGTVPAQASAVDLFVDDARVGHAPIVKELLPQVTEIMRFDYQFETQGCHVVRAQVVSEDDLPADNSESRVVEVLDRMPVLVVDGSPSGFFFQRASSFITTALTPRSDEVARPAAAPAAGGAAAEPSEEPMRFLVQPERLTVAELVSAADLDRFRVIVLANVPRLPTAVTDRLAAFVRKGGGLLVAPGKRAEAAFYNSWLTPAGEPFLPASLAERREPDDPARLELKSFSHPALRLTAEPQHSDADAGLVGAYWKLAANTRDPEVRVGGMLDTGDPFLVERQFGKGWIVMLPVALDRRDSNLPSLKCFVPLVHELVYYLASPMMAQANVKPGTDFTAELAVKGAVPADLGKEGPSEIRVTLPSGRTKLATASVTGAGQVLIRFAETHEPGLYRLRLPASLKTSLPTATNGTAELPFTVLTQPEESSLAVLSDAEMAAVRGYTGMFTATTREDLITAFGGGVPGQELWKILAVGALLTLLGETLLARWIAVQRRFHGTEPVTLRTASQSPQALRDRMRTLLEVQAPGPSGESR